MSDDASERGLWTTGQAARHIFGAHLQGDALRKARRQVARMFDRGYLTGGRVGGKDWRRIDPASAERVRQTLHPHTPTPQGG
jgi:hypothetical protein